MTDADDPDATTVDLAALARRLGVQAESDDRAAVERVLDLAEALPGEPSAGPRARAVREAEDPHGAFRHRFDLPAGDGPLDLELAVKANLAVAGVPTDCGATVEPVVPGRTARVVERLRSAGARVVATTTMDELAYSASGTTGRQRVQNPAAPGRVPGGSSAGSAAAVAAGLVPAALGSDTAGSVRVPAAHCGVVGLKPTRGALPRAGLVDLAPTLDHVGVLAASVESARRVFEAAREADAGDPLAPTGADDGEGDPVTDPSAMRVGVLEEATAAADDGVRAAVDAGAAALADAGASVERIALPEWEHGAPATVLLVGAELAALAATDGRVPGAAGGSLASRLFRRLRERAAHGEGVRRGLVAHGGAAAASEGRTYERATAVRRAVTAAIAAALEEFDVLVSPTTPSVAPPLDEADPASLSAIANTAPLNLSGHPAVSVPRGRSEGVPVGLQVVAETGAETTALAAGAVAADARDG